MEQKCIFMPTAGVESWKQLLASPDKHWRRGYSAQAVAQSWERSGGLPCGIRAVLDTTTEFSCSELLSAVPEYRVHLPGGSRPSQSDVFAILTNTHGLTAMVIEAKVREDFDAIISEWYSVETPGKKERLAFLLDKIAYPQVDISGLRYQLFHRLASAVIMAEKYHAKHAIMVIQSFEPDINLNHFNDFTAFLSPYKISAEMNIVHYLFSANGIRCYALWVAMNPEQAAVSG